MRSSFGAGPELPTAIAQLATREREVALIVYHTAGATAHDVEAKLGAKLSNAAVRSMLSRLVRKGFLRRRAKRTGTRGRGQEFIYLPTLMGSDVRSRAIRRVSQEVFSGSLEQMKAALSALIEREEMLTKSLDV